MFVSTMSPRETVQWFEEHDTQHEILCCFISAEARHRVLLKQLAQNYVDADAALGNRVGFVFFGNSHINSFVRLKLQDGGHRIYMPGEFVLPYSRTERGQLLVPLRELDERRNIWDGRPQAVDTFANVQTRGDSNAWELDELVRSTATVAFEWMDLLNIQHAQLPVLCVLVKGRDAAVVSLGADIEAASINQLFGELGDIARREAQAGYVDVDVGGVAGRLGRAQASMRKIQEAQSKLPLCLDALCDRFNAAHLERQAAVDFLAQERYFEANVVKLLSSFSFANQEDFQNSSEYRRFSKLVSLIRQCRQAIESDMPAPDDLMSLEAKVRAIQMRRDETRRLVEGLQVRGIESRTVAKEALGVSFDRWTGRITRMGDIAKKGAELFRWISGSGIF